MTRYVGTNVVRTEDPRLLTGNGRYVDDIVLPDMLHAAFVRADHAHAKINGIDAEFARTMPGVHAVYLLDDLGEPYSGKVLSQPYPSAAFKQDIRAYPLAKDEVCFVGDPIAIVVADSRYLAEDAAALVQVDYEPLPASVDCRTALDADAPIAHVGSPDNHVATLGVAFGDIEDAFGDAPNILSETFLQHRGGCHSMECRGVLAVEDPHDGGLLTVYSSTQAPYLVKATLANYLELDDARVRVIAPDVGGGFGPKGGVYPEEVVVPIAARLLGRPVKWIEDRREHFISLNQQGDQLWSLDVAADDDGKIRGVRGRIINDNGAYTNYGLVLPITSLFPLPGPYAIPAVDITLDSVFTNTPSKSPVRGAGRPNVAYAMERMIEAVARHLNLDTTVVRARNFVRTDQFPYEPGHKTAGGDAVSYDSGDFHACLDKVKELSDYDSFRERQAVARAAGKYLGIGVSSYIEDTGMGPYEGATVRVQPSGNVQVLTGTASQGQGHATVFSQVVADELGVDIENVVFQAADTAQFPLGVGTVASRTVVAASTAIYNASVAVREKAISLAADVLEAAEEDLELVGGSVSVKGSPGASVTLGELATKLRPFNTMVVPKGFEPGLEATSYNVTHGPPTASGSHIAEVEVDIETGEVSMLRYSVAHDCGRMLNPKLVDGQILGGVVHGLGNALFERMHYDESGQPLSVNYGEYFLPLAAEMPPIAIVHHESPSPLNPLGVKGAGEGGTMPAANAIVSAIENALEPFGVIVNDYPVDPERICDLLDEAEANALT
ncbi:MAG: xanthine dehydrogenase family protein molybdopterin-binding subunit [Acidimicrobiia bacterium]|nr:xanthine dehydrogenase family protein molybdopterin-binding subunit [Acidimicrobiia bacterium]